MMNNKNLISGKQAVYLLIFSIFPAAVLFIPGDPAMIVNQDAWLTIMLATGLALLFIFYPLADLGRRFPGLTIVQYGEKVAGKYLGKLFGLMIIYYYFQLHCWTLRSFAEFTVIFVPETPFLVLYGVISLLTAYAVKNGLEVLARCGEFVFPLGLFFLLLIAVFSIGDMDFANLLPVMDEGIVPLLIATPAPLDWLATGLTFGVLTAYVNNKHDLRKVGLLGVGLSGILLTAFSLISIAVFGSGLISEMVFPYLTLAKYMNPGAFFERLEVLFVMGWVTWIFMAVALSSFATVLSLAQLLRLADYRMLVLPEIVLAVAYSVYEYKSIMEMTYLFSIAHLYYLIFSLGVPFIIWVISLVRLKSI